MKRLLLTLLIGLSGLYITAQTFPYNNEWIDYSKTYYKFYVGKTGLYRISQAALTSAGIGNIPAEQFQLWRNGREVPLHTSVPSGPLSGSDFIEFWGERNDGLPDSTLYRDTSFILNNKYSLQTDTAAFFLTVNPGGGNLRMQNTVNNVAGNVLPPDPYFIYTEGKYYRDYINPGYYIDAGELVHSSAFDKGEGLVSWDIYSGQSLIEPHTLYPYSSGPDAIFRINVFGNGVNQRTFRVKLNADSIYGQQMDYLNQAKASTGVPLSSLINGLNNIEITNLSPGQYDRMVVAQYELEYPRLFNFGNTNNFEFNLAANPAGNYLEISNFNYGSVAPVLYDITNGKRYIGDISNPALLKFALEPSLVGRKLILISLDPANITAVGNFHTRNFINYGLAANQGDYLIISHPMLYAGAGGSNPVENYRAYRSSSAGGNYNAKIYEIDELVDQFAFGIKKHSNSVRNFLRWSRANFSVAPKFVFMIGHAVVYDQYRWMEGSSVPEIEKLNIVPTFGSPASDILLSADVRQQIPLIPIGRLSVISPDEIAIYLTKVQEYEAEQATTSGSIQDKAWMKNIVHVIGGNEPPLVAQLTGYMNKYKAIISDTLFGANVSTFRKSTTETIQQLSDQRLKELFAGGLNQITYFGHSSATVLDFNLDNPEEYNNPGKYPLFIAMGCLAGNFFNFNPARLYTKETLSERWLLTPNRGAIAFLASSHYGIPHYLDIYNTKTYTSESRTMYGRTYGEILRQSVIDVFAQTSQLDFYARMHTEQNTLHGDPALRPNTHVKPDYVIEEPMVKISPSFISVADTAFKVDARYINQGRAINKDIAVLVERQLPGGTFITVLKDTIPGIHYEDSLSIWLPIRSTTDKGLNKIRVTIDVDNAVDESWENNNTVTKDVFIFEDDARPVYPLNYAIINKQNIMLYASTANPFSPSKKYRMEIDTTTLFNSSFKRTVNTTSVGGLLEFNPNITFTDSTVYYWRVSPLDDTSGNPSKWNEASFIYLSNSDVGFNQSHFYQHTQSFSQRVFIDSTNRTWEYHPVLNNLFVRSALYPTGSAGAADYYIAVNGQNILGPGCAYDQLIINVLDPISFKPMLNNTLYDHGSVGCTPDYNREYNFMFPLYDTSGRRRAREFLENIVPDGSYVVIRSNTSPYGGSTYAPVWAADTAYYGHDISLYHTLKNQGFTSIDQYDTTTAFVFLYKKGDLATYTPSIKFTANIYDRILLSATCPTPDTLGYTTSPVFGAAKQWKQLKWRGSTVDATPGDLPTVDLIGIDNTGTETTVMGNLDPGQQDVDISSVSAAQYPYLKIRIRNIDSVHLTPYQLRYWRLTYVPVPEGALWPNKFLQFKDTLDPGEPLDFKVAFKNISDGNFDSLKIKMIITDRNNSQDTITGRLRPLPGNDSLHVRAPINTSNLRGQNTFYLDVNPDNDQPEQFHFNNFMYRNFYVKSDNTNPLLDVTFDGVHILNRDIVASKPHITIKLKDESKWLILDDTSGAKIQVLYPNGVKRTFYFNMNDTLKFTPAGNAPNPDNTATIDFLPNFPLDGEYELTVTGKDKSGNSAGNVEYKVAFQVINKPMISNMLNYPNPFTTSTAFVFTITGAEVPQNIRIQIMTITGKIVREITKDELGPLHIGRNITEFKWDGTDQYGQKLANGIYLYRVITNLNGRSLDKYKAEDDNTDKYFNKGYGKMYLMR